MSEEEEFDTNRSCDVTLTMNGESKVIAKYMRPAKNRTLAAYVAQCDENDNLIYSEDGQTYQYSTEEVSSASLVWSAEDADFRLPVKIDANCEWQVEVPQWLDVEVPSKTLGVVELVFRGESLTEQTGKIVFKAGEQVLKELDVTIPACTGVSVWETVVTEGDFEYDEDGTYLYTDEAVSKVSLVWLGADFRMPVKVKSKCDWVLEMPEWLAADAPSETAGEISFTFTGVPSKYPLVDTEDKVVFRFDGQVLYELPVSIPGCGDIMDYGIDMSLTALEYNAAGMLKTTTGYADVDATAKVFGTKDVRVFAVETTGGVVGGHPSWFSVNVSNFNTAAGADVLQNRDITFKIVENEGYDERSAVVFFLPPSVEDEGEGLFTEGVSVKDEYAAFSVEVSQLSSVYSDYLTLSSADDGTEYEFVKADEVKKAELVTKFSSTDHAYILTYSAEYSRVWFDLAVAYDSFEVFASDDLTTDKSSAEDFWLRFEPGNETKTYGAIYMYHVMELPTEPSTGYIVFYDKNGSVLAILECISPLEEEEVVTPPEGGDEYEDASSYFVNETEAKNSGATIQKVLAGPLYDMSLEEIGQGATILKLTLPAGVAVDIDVKGSYKYYQMPFALRTYITVNNEDYGDRQGITSEKTTAKISMIKIPSEEKDTPMVKFHTSMSETNPFLVIYLFLE